MSMETPKSSASSLRCVLCRRANETVITGALSCKDGTAAHQNCLLYASGIYCKNSPTYDDLFGFDVEDVQKETRRGRKLRCYYCNENGATAGCEVKSCRRSYHYPCAHEARARSEENGSIFRLYCPRHDPHVGSHVGLDKDGEMENGTEGHSKEFHKGGSEERNSSDYETPTRSQSRKRKYLPFASESDETQSIDLEMAPIESEFEDSEPAAMITPPIIEFELNCQDAVKKENEGDEFAATAAAVVCSDPNSQSLLAADFHQEDVPFTVLTDSGSSTESHAENSSKPSTSADPHLNIIIPPTPRVSACPTLDSSLSCTVGKEASREASPVHAERCASRDLPPLQMTFHNRLLGPTSPVQCCSTAHTPPDGPVDQADDSDSVAAHFWRRCNTIGCTTVIFTELTRQLLDLAERVKSQNAKQQDYNVSLRMLKASGRLPAIIQEIEQDMEREETQLQMKKTALRDAKAMLIENQLI